MKKYLLYLFIFCSMKTLHAQSGVTGNLTWEIVNNTLIISGNDAMPDYEYGTTDFVPWSDYRGDIGKIVIGEGVTRIGDYAFYYLYPNITSMIIAASVKSFGEMSFAGCSNLSDFVYAGLEPIPTGNSVMFSGLNFSSCTLLVPACAIDTYKSATGWNSFSHIATIDATLSFKKDEVYFYPGIDGFLIINTVTATAITPYAIAWKSSNTDVATVNYSGNVTAINPGSTVITGYIGCIEASYTFTVFSQGGDDDPITWGILENVLFIRGNGDIPDYQAGGEFGAPWQKYSFKSIDIGYGITGIGGYAFFNCTFFTSVSIPTTVTTIKNNAFCVCRSLISVELSSAVTSIGRAAFSDCTSMSSITVDISNPEYSSENGVLFNKDKTILIAFPAQKTGSYTIPEPVETIYDYAFLSSEISSVVIPNSVTSFNSYAFAYCNNLTSVVIPESVKNIGDRAFYNCINLSEVINLNPTPQIILTDVFSEVDLSTCVLRVFDVTAYQNATEWMRFSNIMAIDTDNFLDQKEIYLLTGASGVLTATIFGEGSGAVTWISSHPEIATVDSNGTITAISPGSAEITAFIITAEARCMVRVVNLVKSDMRFLLYDF